MLRTRITRALCGCCAALIFLAAPIALAQSESAPLTVVTKPAPPFVERDDAGEWSGLAVRLWRDVARNLGWEFTVEERDLVAMLDAVAAGEADIAVGAITVTAEREARADFTHPYFTAGLGIGVPVQRGGVWLAALGAIFSWQFLTAVGALSLVLIVVGLIVWLAERRGNQEQFGGSAIQGLGSGFWWSAVTMTTVGYGDKAPVTLPGRIVGLVWMFASIIIISGFTAGIASALTVSSLGADIQSPSDLQRATAATVAGSTSDEWLTEQGVRRLTFQTIDGAIDAVESGEADAVVYDKPILQHALDGRPSSRIQTLPVEFRLQQYGFALPQGSPLTEQINREILRVVESASWREAVARYRR